MENQLKDAGHDGGLSVRDAFLLLLLVAFPIAFAWQGLDVTDTGYSAANMQQFFRAYPQDLTDPIATSCWLSNFLGAVWCQITPGGGLIGLRMLYLLLIGGLFALAWVPLRRFGASRVLPALLAAMALVIGQSFYFPSYNEFTALFFTLTALALYYGLVRESRLLILLAGVGGGVSIFARFPNLLIGGLVSAVFFYRWIQCDSWERFRRGALGKCWRECGVFVLGYAVGIGGLLLVMAAFGHLGSFLEMLRQLSTAAAGAGDIHSGSSLLKRLARDSAYAGGAGFLFLIAAGALGWLAARRPTRLFRSMLILAAAAGLTCLLLKHEVWGVYFWPGAAYAALLAGALGFLKLTQEWRLLCALAGIVLFTTPLGSGNGIFNAIYAMHLAAPLTLIVLLGPRAGPSPPTPAASSRGWGGGVLDAVPAGCVLLTAMMATSVIHRWGFTYRDTSHRLAMRQTVDHPKLRGVFTTASRAQCLQELLRALAPLVRKDDYLLDHMQIPLVYFLTETKPYLYSTWANLYEPAAFEAALQRALKSRPALPVCVMTKVDTSHPNWPDETYPPQPYPRHVGNRRLIESFLKTHQYQKQWENKAFEIWLPTAVASHG
jgi:hypothetical protein